MLNILGMVFLNSSEVPDHLIHILKGKEILLYQEEIAKLNIEVFRDYPYFYEGELKEQMEFYKIYTNSRYSVAFLAEKESEVIGVILGIPISDFLPVYQEAVTSEGIDLEGIFYLGEIMVKKEYRNQKIGYKLYEKFEAYAKKNYKKILYSEILCLSEPPLGYRKIQTILKGFKLLPHINCEFSWKEIDADQPTSHTMTFWMRDL